MSSVAISRWGATQARRVAVALVAAVLVSVGFTLSAAAATAQPAPGSSEAVFPLRAEADLALSRQVETLLLPPALRSLVRSPQLPPGTESTSAALVLVLAGNAAFLPGYQTEAGRLNLALGRFEEARPLLDAALARDAQDVRALFARALLACLTGDLPRADELVARALTVAPYDREVRYLSGAWAVARGRVAEAPLQPFTELVTDPKSPPGALTLYGVLLEAANRPVEAREAYAKALSREPRDVIALDLAANLDATARDWNRSAAAWSAALESEPGFHPARLGLAQALWGQNRTPEAVKVLDPAKTEYDDGHLSVALTLLSQMEREAGLWREANLHAAAAGQLNPANTIAQGFSGVSAPSGAISQEEVTVYLRRLRPQGGPELSAGPVPEAATRETQLVVGDGDSWYVNATKVPVQVLPGEVSGAIGFWLIPGRGRPEWRRLGLGPRLFDLGLDEGTQVVRGYLVTREGWYLPVSSWVTIDRTPPEVYGVQVTDVGFYSARLSWYTSEFAKSRVELSPGSFSGWDGLEETAETVHAATLQGLEPGVTYYCRISATDAAGNRGAPVEVTFRTPSDSTPPRGGVSINDGETEVRYPRVTLHLWATDRDSGVKEYRVSGDGFIWSEWRAFSGTVEYLLSGSDGLKRVFVQYRDNAGNVSEVYQATITLDSHPLRIRSLRVSDVTVTSAVISWSTNEPAVSEVTYWGAGRTYRQREEYRQLEHRVTLTGLSPGTDYSYEVRSANATGDEAVAGPERFRTLIQTDTSPPRGSLAINDGAPVTDRPEVVLHLSAYDNWGGPLLMSLSNDRHNWSRWEALAPSKQWRLDPPDGVKTVYARFQDEAGNVGEASATIRLDSAPPRITDARIEQLAADAATFTWSTTEPTTGTVTCAAGREVWTGSDDRLGRDHRVVIRGLRPGTSYVWTVRAVDAAGKQVTAGPYQFQTPPPRDVNPPRGSIFINNGALTTASLDVTLQVTVADDSAGPISMCLSNDRSTWSRWEPVAPVKSWRLQPPAGQKTVYARFRDEAGNESQASASIRLDQAAPRFVQARVENITANSAAFVWVTDVPSVGRVNLSARGEKRSAEDRTLGTTHRLVIDGLRPQTAYAWTITASDGQGGSATYDGGSFTTSGGPPPPPPPPPPPGAKPTNVALGGKATASSFDEKHPPQNAIDGNAKTAWEPVWSGSDEWLEVRLPRVFRIDSVVIRGDVSGTGVTVTVQYSSGGKWIDAGVQGNTKDRRIDLKKTAADGIRIQISQTRSWTKERDKPHPNRVRVEELEIWGVP